MCLGLGVFVYLSVLWFGFLVVGLGFFMGVGGKERWLFPLTLIF